MMSSPTWAGSHAAEISSDPQDYIFFLSKEEVPYGCFSNAHRERNGHSASSPDAPKFWCINQELHYQKAVLFQDNVTAQKILAEQNDATKIKQLGRMVQGYDDAKWCEVRYDVCRNALHAKFAQNDELEQILLDTGTQIIVEAAKDGVWGIGCVEYTTTTSDTGGVLGAKNKETGRWDIAPNDWEGGNLLGRCLMDVRKILSESGC